MIEIEIKNCSQETVQECFLPVLPRKGEVINLKDNSIEESYIVDSVQHNIVTFNEDESPGHYAVVFVTKIG